MMLYKHFCIDMGFCRFVFPKYLRLLRLRLCVVFPPHINDDPAIVTHICYIR